MQATLRRFYKDSKQTLGYLTLDDTVTTPIFTLERPWLDNKNDISCVPPGVYDVTWLSTPKFPLGVYQLQNVTRRTGIDIHAANKVEELEGCIALGLGIGCDTDIRLTSSAAAILKFQELTQKSSFQLTIDYI